MSHNNSKTRRISLPDYDALMNWDRIRLRVEGKHIVMYPYKQKKAAKASRRQLEQQHRFKKAAKYAKQMLQDPGKLAEVPARLRQGGKAYVYFVTEYLRSVKPKEAEQANWVPSPLSHSVHSVPGKAKQVTAGRAKRSKKPRC